MTKSEQKQVNRALAQGRGAYLRTLAIIHRAGSTRTQREVETMMGHLTEEYVWVNGALVHQSEV